VALPAPLETVVALPAAPDDPVVGVVDDFELLLQAASSNPTASAPITVNVERRRSLGAF
jgi:hypothetical protein